MIAPPGSPEELDRFVRIADHLRRIDLCAPAIDALDAPAGLMLLEDLGPDHAAAWLRTHPADEPAVYATAATALVRLQAHPPPEGLPRIDRGRAVEMLSPLFDHATQVNPADRARLETAMDRALGTIDWSTPVTALRDFHAENIIWRPRHAALNRLGLLDFQDAVRAPRAYDLASLLDDVRRDVGPAAEAAVLDTFARETGMDRAALDRDRALLSVQRNLRILGIFARLIHVEGKTRYAAFLPRLRHHLARQLAHPALSELRDSAAPFLSERAP